ncbi:hypothetical protein [Pseudonocardia humida]|uniref:ArsR family transcriptional regulator n=1 Tax=Pseudonocardia humida TaxID=2800819 RepID=A0ABT1A2D8_9PSEU|nr:hypothetical protein [Pseudonocardia humida]MCO1657174.1 hypothetical protein [Pseudonocardia humida]
MEFITEVRLSGRDRAILRAVAAGDAELSWGAEPDLLLGGRYCCDQPAAHRLARAGLIAPVRVCATGQRVPARVTPAGMRELSAPALTAA